MSVPQIPPPGKIFLSILSSKWELFWPNLLSTIEQKWGKADYISKLLDFNYTNYYDNELGVPIKRIVVSFERLVPLDSLPQLKLFTNHLETKYKQSDKRIFNLDPGLITCERLVLATGKNFTHRVYLGQGIFADLTLIYTKEKWQILPWTFPDYASHEMQKHLTNIREIYKKQRQKGRKI